MAAPQVDIGASGVIGVAIESEQGVYEEPTKFFPIRSESIQWEQENIPRRVIRGTADVIGMVRGDGHPEGSVDMEALDDVLPYWLAAARGEMTKEENTDYYTYTFTPSSRAVPDRTLSVTLVRNEQVFAYTGMVVGSMEFSIDDGMLVLDVTLMGRDEDDSAEVPSETFGEDWPFGAGSYTIEIPTGTVVEDTDEFTLTIDENAEVQYRLLDRTGAAFIAFGDRDVTASVERDFKDKSVYDDFRDVTSRSLKFRAEQDGEEERFIEIELNRAFVESHEVSLDDTGDLIRASVEYTGTDTEDGEGSYVIKVGTTEDVDVE